MTCGEPTTGHALECTSATEQDAGPVSQTSSERDAFSQESLLSDAQQLTNYQDAGPRSDSRLVTLQSQSTLMAGVGQRGFLALTASSND